MYFLTPTVVPKKDIIKLIANSIKNIIPSFAISRVGMGTPENFSNTNGSIKGIAPKNKISENKDDRNDIIKLWA